MHPLIDTIQDLQNSHQALIDFKQWLRTQLDSCLPFPTRTAYRDCLNKLESLQSGD